MRDTTSLRLRRMPVVVGMAVLLAASLWGAGCRSGANRLVGEVCTSADDCRDLCATGNEFPDGFCTTACLDDLDCPGDTVCAEFGGDGLCTFPCDSDLYCADLLQDTRYECRDRDTPDGRVVLVCHGN